MKQLKHMKKQFKLTRGIHKPVTREILYLNRSNKNELIVVNINTNRQCTSSK
jgi:hypothetical protein